MPRSPLSWLSQLPLRSRLPMLFAALLLVGLVLTGAIALTLLRQSLVGELDGQLERQAPRLVEQFTGGIPEGGSADETLPSEYYLLFSAPDGAPRTAMTARTATAGAPQVPRMTVQEVAALEPDVFTVPGTQGERWRVVTRPLAGQDGRLLGSIAVALPMTAADATLGRMRVALLAIGVTVVGLGALAGWWGVRRALRPLRQIEDTAAAIADGDLTRRVPDAPASTEVGHLSGSLNGMLAQVERAFAARTASEERMRRFVADASHELRTPLATIRGYGELYRMGGLQGPEEPERTLRRIEDSATRMGALVEDLLHLARLDEGRPMRREPVDLAVLAADAAADLRALDPERTVRLDPVAPGAPVGGTTTTGDPDRLRQVVANLIGNVARHTPAGSPVELVVGRVPGPDGAVRAVLEVRDHGPGIDPEHAERVFERFYRLDAARGRETGGAGLGMAIVAAIVRAHTGEVTITPTRGGGATVRVALPASDGPPPPPPT